MKKRAIALALALCMVSVVLITEMPTASALTSSVEQTIRSLGIMVGDEHGNMNLTSPVSRAQFAKMMVAASPYKDTIGQGYGYSLFKDVKSDYWASEYIKLAVNEGWVTGYVDGTFHPDNTITLEEACTALLRMLGYTASSLGGSFPTAQLSKAQSIGLLDGISAIRGQVLSRNDCMALLYNLLTAKNSSGTVFATTLGYTVTNGEVNYSTVVTAGTKGPYIASSGTLNLPFDLENCTIYLNGSLSSSSEVSQYDVYYYSINMRTVWVYDKRVAGTLKGVSPTSSAPTTVTVAGNSYTIGTSDATYKLSNQGAFSAGDTVTLLLGMNGEVVDVLTAVESNAVYYGIVLSSEDEVNSTTNAKVYTEVKVACTDGSSQTFYTKTDPSIGEIVCVTINEDGTSLEILSTRSISGTVNQNGTKLGNLMFADEVEILDTDGDGGYVRIYPSRLTGLTLTNADVLYYLLNEKGEISRLILDEVTGDTVDYGFLTSVKETSSSTAMNINGTYQYYLNGTSKTIKTNNMLYNVSVGGAAIYFDSDGSVSSFKNLESVSLGELHALYAMSGNQKYYLAEDVQVLLEKDREYYATTLSAVNSESYSFMGWYDNTGNLAGGRIRIIVAVVK